MTRVIVRGFPRCRFESCSSDRRVRRWLNGKATEFDRVDHASGRRSRATRCGKKAPIGLIDAGARFMTCCTERWFVRPAGRRRIFRVEVEILPHRRRIRWGTMVHGDRVDRHGCWFRGSVLPLAGSNPALPCGAGDGSSGREKCPVPNAHPVAAARLRCAVVRGVHWTRILRQTGASVSACSWRDVFDGLKASGYRLGCRFESCSLGSSMAEHARVFSR